MEMSAIEENGLKSPPSASRKVNSFLNLIGWICSVASMLLGYTTGVINGALPFLVDDLQLSPLVEGIVVTSLLIGAAFGSLAGGRLADRFGRKSTLLGCNLLYLAGTFCASMAPNVELLIAGRVFLGFIIGGFSSPVTVMLAELSTPACRERMVTRSFLMVMVGEFGAFLVNAILGILWSENKAIWRWMCVLGVFPAILELALIFWIMPESPRWLVSVGRPKEAHAILKRIRANEAEAEEELKEIQNLGKNNGEGEDGQNDNGTGFGAFFSLLSECWFVRSMLIGIGIGLCQAAEGGAIIMYYGTSVLRDNNGNDMRTALLGNIGNGVQQQHFTYNNTSINIHMCVCYLPLQLVSLLACAAGLWLIARVPRRPMFLIGLFGSAIPHSLIALSCWLLPNGPIKGWVILFGMLTFLVLQQGAIMTVSWLLLTEMFPLRVRGLAVGICFWFAWMNNFLTSMLFPLAFNGLDYPLTFAFVVFLCFIAGLFVLLCVPETRGKSLERLEMEFRGMRWKKEDEEKAKRAIDAVDGQKQQQRF